MRDTDGSPLQGACVRALDETPDEIAVSPPTGEDGRYELNLASAGNYDIDLVISSCSQGVGAYELKSGSTGFRPVNQTQQLDWVVQLLSPLYVYYNAMTGLSAPVTFCIDGVSPCRDAAPDQPAIWTELVPGTTYRLRFRDHPEYTTELYVSVTRGYITKSCPMQPPWWPCN